MNGLVRQYLSKGTDLSVYSQEELDAIADEINKRPRKGLGVIAAVCLQGTATEQSATLHSHPLKFRALHFTFESALSLGQRAT
jgi:hypothetical protein